MIGGGHRLLPRLIFAMVAYSGAKDQWHQALNTPCSSGLPLECLLDFRSMAEKPIHALPPFSVSWCLPIRSTNQRTFFFKFHLISSSNHLICSRLKLDTWNLCDSRAILVFVLSPCSFHSYSLIHLLLPSSLSRHSCPL